MANSQKLSKTNVSSDLMNRIMFVLGALFVYRFGAHIPVPGVDPVAMSNMVQQSSNGLLGMLNLFSGGALQRFSIFAIGIMPYISSSIVMQLAGEIIPSLKALKKEGEAGRRVITKYTRIGTIILATFQSLGMAKLLLAQPGIVIIGPYEFYLSTVVCLVTGTMFLMWLGEQITERGIGNGISIIICAGIAASIPTGIYKVLDMIRSGSMNLFVGVMIFAGALVLIYFVVFVESGQRKIPIHYAKRQVTTRSMAGGQTSHVPFKLNMAGVIPPIFASSILAFLGMAINWITSFNAMSFLQTFSVMVTRGQPVYLIIFAASIFFFSYFYTAIMYSPREIAENLKKGGAIIPGIRPGEQTSKYLEKVILRLTFYGALYITFVCVIPELLIQFFNIPVYLGGTSLLILVVVTMDFTAQLSSYQVSQQYENLMNRSTSRRK
ncbi:preprotein translocase subunit SecY [Neisseriaceae bacterium PsAf]|nr:preprotein translocase subunit SecY [Neisseriaceae bacterium PsAf]